MILLPSEFEKSTAIIENKNIILNAKDTMKQLIRSYPCLAHPRNGINSFILSAETMEFQIGTIFQQVQPITSQKLDYLKVLK
jgi:hypothetical protein